MVLFHTIVTVVQLVLVLMGVVYGYSQSKSKKSGAVISSGLKLFLYISFGLVLLSYIQGFVSDFNCSPLFECGIEKAFSIFAYIPLMLVFVMLTGFGIILGISLRNILKKKK